jgi:hypothetical protein
MGTTLANRNDVIKLDPPWTSLQLRINRPIADATNPHIPIEDLKVSELLESGSLDPGTTPMDLRPIPLGMLQASFFLTRSYLVGMTDTIFR